MLPFRAKIEQTGKKIALESAFERPWFGGWQTFLGVVKTSHGDIKVQQTESFENTKSVIEWTDFPTPQKDNKKTFLIFPGLTGNSQTNYVVSTIKTMRKYNYKIGVYRSSFLSKVIKEGRIRVMQEVETVLKQLKQTQPDRDIQCVGFSNGANQILHYVGKSAEECVVSKLMVVSCPFDLNKIAQDISRQKSHLLHFLAYSSVRLVKDKFVGYNLDWDHIRNSKTLYEFDDRFSRIICQYPTVNEYYDDSSSSKYIDQIYIPVLALHSKDDAFCPISAVPQTSEKISFLLTTGGGHNAFVTWRFKYWFLRPLQEFFSTENSKLYA